MTNTPYHSGDAVALTSDRLTDTFNEHLRNRREARGLFWPHRTYGLALRLLKSSNALTGDCADGVPPAEPFSTRHAVKVKP